MTWTKMTDEVPPHGEKFDIWTVMKGQKLDQGNRIADVMWAKRMGGGYVLHGRENMVSPALVVTHWMKKPAPPEGDSDGNYDQQSELLRTPPSAAPTISDYSETG